MIRVYRVLLLCSVAVGFALILPACNTVKGAGKDLETASEKTEQAIDRATK